MLPWKQLSDEMWTWIRSNRQVNKLAAFVHPNMAVLQVSNIEISQSDKSRNVILTKEGLSRL